MIRLLRIVAITALIAGIPSIARATSLAPLSIEQMTDASDLVVRGVVEDVRTEVEPSGRIYTIAEVRVTEGLKGRVDEGDYVSVVTPGGSTPEGDKAEVPSAPRFSTNEDALLFLWARNDGETYGTVGLALGKYTVKQNPTDGSDMVVRFTVPFGQSYDARFIPNPPAEKRISFASLESQIKARVELGWDGKPIPGVSDAHLREINRLQNGVK